MHPAVIALGLVIFAYCAWIVAGGVRTGVIEPMTRGWTPRFDRGESPWGFWLSVAWNAAIGVFSLLCSIQLLRGL